MDIGTDQKQVRNCGQTLLFISTMQSRPAQVPGGVYPTPEKKKIHDASFPLPSGRTFARRDGARFVTRPLVVRFQADHYAHG